MKDFLIVLSIYAIVEVIYYFTIMSSKPLFILCSRCGKTKLRFFIKKYEIVTYALDGSGFYEAECCKCGKSHD